MGQEYSWKTVTTFAATDQDSSDQVQQFNIKAATLGITVLSAHQFQPVQVGNHKDFTVQINAAKAAGARIFVLCMDTYSAAQ